MSLGFIKIGSIHQLRDGSKHNETTMRSVDIPPYKIRQENLRWDLSEFKNRWDLIYEKLKK